MPWRRLSADCVQNQQSGACLMPGRPVPEGTFTHSHPSGSSCFLYHLSPFATVHSILFIQLTCLTVLNVQPLSMSSLVFPLVLDPQLHAPYISSLSHRHLFATHDRTSAAYSAAIPMLCHLHLVSLSSLLGSLSFSLTPHIHLTMPVPSTGMYPFLASSTL